VRVVREIDARRRIGGASAGIDAERADFPVGRNRPNHEEDKDQGGGEKQEAEPPAAATIRFVTGPIHPPGWACDDDGLGQHEAGWRCSHCRLHRHDAGWGCGDDGVRRRAGCGWGYRGLGGCCRGNGRSRLRRTTRQRLQPGPSGADWRWRSRGRRRDRGRGGDILDRRVRQIGKPLLQLCLIGSLIFRWYGTPWEAHVRPR